MSSRSSSNAAAPGRLPVGRVRGHRGRSGEVTVVVPAGDPEQWVDVSEFQLQSRGSRPETYSVESARAYGNRLVLKFSGVDDGNQAAGLKGMIVSAAAQSAPSLEPNEHYRAELVGMNVTDVSGTAIGTVGDVWPTGSADLLVVHPTDSALGDEVFFPMTQEIVPEIDREKRTVVVNPPEGLLGLNRDDAAEPVPQSASRSEPSDR